jgi:hypothetical protein
MLFFISLHTTISWNMVNGTRYCRLNFVVVEREKWSDERKGMQG